MELYHNNYLLCKNIWYNHIMLKPAEEEHMKQVHRFSYKNQESYIAWVENNIGANAAKKLVSVFLADD